MLDIDFINKQIANKDKKYTDFNLVYPFLTENFKGFSEEFYLKNKRILTVCSYGDQILDMYLGDAKAITAFDINPLCEYYFNLKRAFILSGATLDDYLTFFCSQDNTYCFNRNDYEIIKKYLEKEYLEFWDYLYNNYSVFDIRLNNNFFSPDENEISLLKNITNYLNEENFFLMKDKLKDIKFDFINTNILELNNKLKYKYDLIYLSNIAQYLPNIYGKDLSISKTLQLYKELIYKLDEHLTYRGKIMTAYIYQVKTSNINNPMKCQILRDRIFNDDFYYLYFRSMASFKRTTFNDENIDGTLMYKKRR